MSSVKETVKEQKYWRSLDQLEGTPEFEEFLHREFPQAASEFPEGISRRRWLQVMGASFALAGLTGCRWEKETIAPFATRPANRIPGKSQKFATMVNRGGYAQSLLVSSVDGRPIKVEGNNEHSASLGATTAFDQAETLMLYDPDRAATVSRREKNAWADSTWEEALAALEERLTEDGSGFAVLSEGSTSLTEARLKQALQEKYTNLKWYSHESLSRENEWKGAELAFGTPLRPQYDLSKADIVLSINADLLGMHPNSVAQVRAWADRRVPEAGEMNRWYVVESEFSSTGTAADHRQPLKASAIPAWLTRLEQALTEGHAADNASDFDKAVVDDLTHHKGSSLVVAGSNLPPEVHAVVARINNQLENLGQTVTYTSEPLAIDESIVALSDSIDGGNVDSLLILGGNPAYTAAADLTFGEKLAKIPFTAHLGLYRDETSRLCKWHLPLAHPFECWGDGFSYNGVHTLQQPLIEPLHGGKSAIQLLAILNGEGETSDRDLVSETFRSLGSDNDTDAAWEAAIHRGFSENGGLETESASLQDSAASISLSAMKPASGLELTLASSSSLYDGRYANNGWLQETPDPLTKLVWDNVALISLATAERLEIENYTFVKVRANGKTFEIPAYILPGQPDDTISIELGYGRTAAGIIGGHVDEDVESVGIDVGILRTTDQMHLVRAVELEPTGRKAELASTQDHHLIDEAGMEEIAGRIGELVREGTLSRYKDHPDFAKHIVHEPPLESLFEELEYDGPHKWGMSIDLSRCIGCNACSVACQSENNVPIVGKEQVARGREMHWLRIDRYFSGDIENPQVANQMVACQQCENAPCEQVCPVAATVHSDEGLNDMVYNRCVGTRYCGNNCPYKVRRFNFLNFNKPYERPGKDLLGMVLNPEVTVRHRGVMEKCTFCVQRIQNAKIDAKTSGRELQDGDVKSACQQACAANAIEFGDLRLEESNISKAHGNDRSYAMLSELNVKPRNKYLARIRNPHPSMEPEIEEAHGHGHDDHGHDDHAHGDHDDDHKHEDETGVEEKAESINAPSDDPDSITEPEN